MQNIIQKYPAKYTLPVFGLVAGVLSFVAFLVFLNFLFLREEIFAFLFLLISPGLIFGVVIATFFFFKKEKQGIKWKVPIWILMSTVSWALVYSTVFFEILIFIWALFFANLIIVQGVHWLFVRLSALFQITIIVAGSVVSFLLYFIEFKILEFNIITLLPSFIIWQTGMAFLLGWAIDSARKREDSSLIVDR